MDLDALLQRMGELGATRFLAKELAANDNSKNQIYVGGSSDVFAVLPPTKVHEDMNQSGVPSFKALLSFCWLNDAGECSAAPQTQLIYYPQYPEVRLSGFLRGSPTAPSEILRGRREGRVLVLGVSPDRQIFGFACADSHSVAQAIANIGRSPDVGVFYTLEPAVPAGTEPRRKLLEEVCRISRIGWIRGKRLSANGSTIPCNSTNSGGYTFEAELGIVPNGYSAPDYLGWEIKSFTVSSLTTPRGGPITLMTPEPNGGVYAKQGPEHFVRTYGYPDKAGRPDRINFGGIFRIGKISENTGLRLDLLGFDFERGLLSASDGRLVLVDPDDVVAAPWSFRGLLEHWMRKHAKVAYIPALMENEHGERRYKFGQDIFLGEGTDFNRLLKGLASGHVYYDPGLKVEGASTPHPRMKRRSQIRIRFSHAPSLYNSWTTVDACD